MATNPRAIELFAGVGGFRLGLAKSGWDVVWSNQWEPSTKRQDASDIYVRHFGDDGHVCMDINEVLQSIRDEETSLPSHDILVGGFPCQDYSVARTLNQATGLSGKKGVLWWSIHEILSRYLPRFVLLENVDRLLKSPATQRGRDFAIMLSSLANLGYQVQWRVINAADYGFPQRRRRVFIVGELTNSQRDPADVIFDQGILARALPVSLPEGNMFDAIPLQDFQLDESLETLSEEFGIGAKISRFRNAGVMQGHQVHTIDVVPDYAGTKKTLNDILQQPQEIDEESFSVPEHKYSGWEYLKGAKNEPRIHKGSGTQYIYTEGKVAFPDSLNKPSRTLLTGEGGPSPSRFKHVIETTEGNLRRLTPVEMERLNGFPDDWTEGVSNNRRAFLMGNALVIGIVEKIGTVLKQEIANFDDRLPW